MNAGPHIVEVTFEDGKVERHNARTETVAKIRAAFAHHKTPGAVEVKAAPADQFEEATA